MRFDYKIVPAPTKGKKVKGARSPEARYAAALEDIMSQHAKDGWQYKGREEHHFTTRTGLLGKIVRREQGFLVFQRAVESAEEMSVVAPTAATVDPAPAITASTALNTPAAPEEDDVFSASLDPNGAQNTPPESAQDLVAQIQALSKRLEGLNDKETQMTTVAQLPGGNVRSLRATESA